MLSSILENTVLCYRWQCRAVMPYDCSGDVPVMVEPDREVYVCSDECAVLLETAIESELG